MTQIYDSPTESSTTEQAKEKAQAAAGQAKDKAGSQLRSQVDQRSTDAGHAASVASSDVRAMGESLREQGKDQPARLAEQAADRAERLGGYLEEATPIASSPTSRTSAVGVAVGRDRRWRGHRSRRLALPQGLVDRPLREAHERPAARAGRPGTDHAARVDADR